MVLHILIFSRVLFLTYWCIVCIVCDRSCG